MTDFRDQDFNGKDVELDGNTFTGCTFRNCRVFFRAQGSIALVACKFKEDINWVFAGAAANTAAFLSLLFHKTGEGGREFVEQYFEKIRRGTF